MPDYFYYDGDQRRIITEDSQGRTYFLYENKKTAVEQDASGTTQAAYMSREPRIYDVPLNRAASGAIRRRGPDG